jgi:hypothetical protein
MGPRLSRSRPDITLPANCSGFGGARDWGAQRDTTYQVRHLERPALGTPYPAIVARVREPVHRAPISPAPDGEGLATGNDERLTTGACQQRYPVSAPLRLSPGIARPDALLAGNLGKQLLQE